jgi:hypothetical protein
MSDMAIFANHRPTTGERRITLQFMTYQKKSNVENIAVAHSRAYGKSRVFRS